MVKANIRALITLLAGAETQGCSKVKLQLGALPQEEQKEQKSPKKKDEYLLDTLIYNTVEFDTEIGQIETDRIISWIQGDTLIIRVSITDWESLREALGIASFYS